MTPPNPSEAAREAARQIQEMFKNGHQAICCDSERITAIIQSALDSALAASAARVKELEALCERAIECIESCDHGCGDLLNSRHCSICQEAASIRRALSIKVPHDPTPPDDGK